MSNKNNELIKTGEEYLMNTYTRFPLALVKGQGSYVWDADGQSYLDFAGGIAVCALGHCPEELVKALQEQSQALWHVSNLYWIEPQVKLAEKLVKNAEMSKAFFCNSGAEANEAALKLARKYFYRQDKGHKNEIISFVDSFHGRTLAAVTATGQPKYHEGFGPLPGGFKYARFNDIDSVKDLINPNTAAILVEPIQGESGIKPASPAFLKDLRALCDQHDLKLIFDEVQCGLSRTGSLFAFQQYGVKPDIVTLAKGLGGGFPIGAMLASKETAQGFRPGDHASTFGGNPLATAVANQVIDIITAPLFLEEVNKNARLLHQALQKIEDGRIVEIRSRGLMLGIEFNTENRGLIEICIQKGLLLVGAGPLVVRFLPPLNVSAAEIGSAVEIFRSALAEWD